MDFLNDLYFGKINVSSDFLPRGEEYLKAEKNLSDKEDSLTEMLSDDAKKLFDEVMDANSIYTGASNAESFKVGFKLGARMMFECLIDNKNDLSKILK